ncbi:MAG: BtpA/SgcQ family protein [Alphaproteobacteria bacterium]|nr:BtpA/SgcQ family protein [Alphaproteobacteria bacterium]
MATFFGVVHLLPLPGSPRGVGLEAVRSRALADAQTLAEGGVDGLIVENFGDAPFARGAVDAFTLAQMTALALDIRRAVPGVRLGINVLRNDARAALAIAAAVGADLIRVNVHTGAMVTDQGIIEGDARTTLLDRARFAPGVQIAADVLVKHAVPLGQPDIADVARDTARRGLADVLIVTGSGTGQAHDPARVRAVKQAVPERPVWVGSGITPETAATLEADGAIVGTWLHADGDLSAPLDPTRVRTMAEALHG